MKKISLFISIALLLNFTAFSESKIGFVDTKQILAGTKIGVEVSEKLEKKQKVEREKLFSFQENIKKLEKELSSPSLDKTRKESLSRDLFNAKRELKSKYDELTMEFQKYTQSELEALENKINPIIQKMGKAGGFTAIYDIQRSGTIYIENSANLTLEVIKAIDREFPL